MQSLRVSVNTRWPYGLRAYGDVMGVGLCLFPAARTRDGQPEEPVRAAVQKSELLGRSHRSLP